MKLAVGNHNPSDIIFVCLFCLFLLSITQSVCTIPCCSTHNQIKTTGLITTGLLKNVLTPGSRLSRAKAKNCTSGQFFPQGCDHHYVRQ